MVDTAQQSDRQLWEDLAARAVGGPVPYRPAPGIAVYHISVDDDVVIAAEHDLIGSLSDLVTAVLALGGELLEQSVSPTVASSLPLDDLDRGDTAVMFALAAGRVGQPAACCPGDSGQRGAQASIAYGIRRRLGYENPIARNTRDRHANSSMPGRR
jgi:hypothetical protein